MLRFLPRSGLVCSPAASCAEPRSQALPPPQYRHDPRGDRYHDDMFVTPRELRDADIPTAKGGFHKDAVDDMLERAADTIEELQRRVAELEATPAMVAPPADPSQPSQELIQRTLLLAQKAADDAISEARTIATRLVGEADAEAQARKSAAIQEAAAAFEMSQRELQSEIEGMTFRRDALMRDVAALEDFHERYEARVSAFIQDEMLRLQNRPQVDASLEPPVLESVNLSNTPAEVPFVEAVTAQSTQAEAEPLEAMIVDAREQEEPVGVDSFVASLRDAVGDDQPSDLFSEANRAEYRDLF